MTKHKKLWDDGDDWERIVNAGSWIILVLLAVISLCWFLDICGISPK